MSFALVLGLVFSISVVGTGLLRRYALHRSILDIPNARSSHSIPTPRGGGVAIVVAFIAGVVALVVLGRVAPRAALALGGAGGIVALVGFVDDHRPLAARWRLLAHFAAAIWALAWSGGLSPVAVGGHVLELGLTGDAAAAVGIVWLLNLYNFMDGIDGLASIEALSVCLGAAALCWVHAPACGEVVLALTLGVAVLGFLLWNFPPARIFMGDAGSGFLGLTLGVLMLQAGAVSPRLLWCWLILLGVFIVDATFTLLRRLAHRERVSEAHRSHAYQHAAQRAGGHRPVTMAVGAINLCWLLPIALLVAAGRIDGAVGLVVAYLPLVLVTWRLGAGLRTP